MARLTIAFFGPDGSGKTTLAQLLKNILAKKHGKVKVFWMRGMHTLALLIGLLLSKFSSMQSNDTPFLRLRLRSRSIWCLLEVISLLPILLKFKFLKTLYPVIIAERCHIDSAVWLRIYYSSNRLCGKVSSLLIKMGIYEFDVLTYVTAGLDTLLERKRNEGSNKEFLLRQRLLYEAHYNVLVNLIDAYKVSLLRLDTSKASISESLLKILHQLYSHVK